MGEAAGGGAGVNLRGRGRSLQNSSAHTELCYRSQPTPRPISRGAPTAREAVTGPHTIAAPRPPLNHPNQNSDPQP